MLRNVKNFKTGPLDLLYDPTRGIWTCHDYIIGRANGNIGASSSGTILKDYPLITDYEINCYNNTPYPIGDDTPVVVCYNSMTNKWEIITTRQNYDDILWYSVDVQSVFNTGVGADFDLEISVNNLFTDTINPEGTDGDTFYTFYTSPGVGTQDIYNKIQSRANSNWLVRQAAYDDDDTLIVNGNNQVKLNLPAASPNFISAIVQIYGWSYSVYESSPYFAVRSVVNRTVLAAAFSGGEYTINFYKV